MDIRGAKSILIKLLNNINPVTSEEMPSSAILEETVVKGAFRVFLDFEYEGELAQEVVEEK